MSKISSIEKKSNTPYLNFYEMEAHFRDGHVAPYYVASRAKEIGQLKAVSGRNDPDGVILYGVYGEEKDKVVLIRQYRYPLGGFIYEFPAGLVEKGESYQEAGVREFHEETGMTLIPETVDEAYMKPRFTTIGMTDESCAAVFGRAVGTPSRALQEGAEEIEIVLADKSEVRRILKEEQVAVMCAYMLYHFLAAEGDPFDFLHKGGI